MKVFFDEIEPENVELIEIKKVDNDYKLYVNGKVSSEFINHHLVFHFQYPYIYAEIVYGAKDTDPYRYTAEEMQEKAHELAGIIVGRKESEFRRMMGAVRLCWGTLAIAASALLIVAAITVIRSLGL